MSRALLALAVLALAACGGGEAEREPPTLSRPEAAADPADAMRAFVAAAARGEHGPEYSEGVGSFAGTDFEVFLDELWGETAIVAVAGERLVEGSREQGVFAAPFVRRDGVWELKKGIPPDLVLGEGFDVRADADEVRIWIDGQEVDVEREGDRWHPAEEPEPGPHAVVAAIRKDGEVFALGWKGAVGTGP